MLLLQKLKESSEDKVYDIFVSTAPCGACSQSLKEAIANNEVKIRSLSYFDSSYVRTEDFKRVFSRATLPLRLCHLGSSGIKVIFSKRNLKKPINIGSVSWGRSRSDSAALVAALLDWDTIEHKKLLRRGLEEKMMLESRAFARTDMFWNAHASERLLADRNRICMGIQAKCASSFLSKIMRPTVELTTAIARAKSDKRLLLLTLDTKTTRVRISTARRLKKSSTTTSKSCKTPFDDESETTTTTSKSSTTSSKSSTTPFDDESETTTTTSKSSTTSSKSSTVRKINLLSQSLPLSLSIYNSFT